MSHILIDALADDVHAWAKSMDKNDPHRNTLGAVLSVLSGISNCGLDYYPKSLGFDPKPELGIITVA